MKDSKFTIRAEYFKILKKETENIKDLEYLTSKILEKIKESETCLVSRFENTDRNSVKWMDANPIDSYVKSAWGCQKQYSFCGEPCPQTEGHFESYKSHTCMQHRPLCCIVIEAWIMNCHVWSLGNFSFKQMLNTRAVSLITHAITENEKSAIRNIASTSIKSI
jgi:hypothetical protein